MCSTWYGNNSDYENSSAPGGASSEYENCCEAKFMLMKNMSLTHRGGSGWYIVISNFNMVLFYKTRK